MLPIQHEAAGNFHVFWGSCGVTFFPCVMMRLFGGGQVGRALTSALLAQGLERAREHATLRALGLSPNGLTALVTIQAAGLTLVALLLALPLAVLIHYALTLLVQPRAFGWSLPLSLPPLEPVWLVAPTALVLGALTGLYPGWRLRRRSIVQHLRAGR